MHRKYYNVSIIGDVQDIGFRKFVESTANSYHVTGYVFNDTNGSVKMLCAGQVELLNTFFDAVQTRPPQGTSIEQFIKTEIPIPEDFDLNIPDQFLKLTTDQLADIGNKLDIGVELLKTLPQIEESVSTLPEIKTGIDTLNSKFDDFRTDQQEHNKRMEEHNKRMEKHNKRMEEHNKQLTQILQKLSEK
jgi:acylphosphatase